MEVIEAARAYVEGVRDQVNATLDAWTDPSDAVRDEKDRNDALAQQLQQQQDEFAQLQAIETRDKQLADETYRAEKSKAVELADMKLDSIDTLSIAKLVYDEVESSMSKMGHQIRAVGQDELGRYGYQSKMLFSLGITFEAARDAILHSRPFAKELETLSEELQDANAHEVSAVIKPMRPFTGGVTPKLDISKDAVNLAAAVSAAHMDVAQRAASEKRDASADAGDVDDSVVPAVRGWLSMLRVPMPTTTSSSSSSSNDAAVPTTSSSSEQAVESDRLAVEAVKMAASEGDLEKVLAALPALDGLADKYAPVREATAKVRYGAESRLVADIGIRYSDSMLALRRFAFVENMIHQ